MKTYHCSYCNEKLNRDKLIKHIEHEHEEEIPIHYTAYRLVYDIVNDKHGHGNCIICGKETKWNEKRQKYERLCGNPECYRKVRETYESRMMRVYNKTTLLDDPYHQEKMLASRKISGTYKWSDGKLFTYTGSYEKALMEFLDKTLEFRSDEIIAPGPILVYKFDGKDHHWITDFLIIPYNLIIEVKDGGSNPNTNKAMVTTRAKTVAKEKMITDAGTYNYIRLTNNNFGQLLGILAELKMQIVDHKEGPIIRIHESLYPRSEDEYINNKTEIAYNITETAYDIIDNEYNNIPINIIENSFKITDGFGDSEDKYVIECFYIEPGNKNKIGIEQFKNFAESLYNKLKYMYPLLEDDLIMYYNNNDIKDGMILGLAI